MNELHIHLNLNVCAEKTECGFGLGFFFLRKDIFFFFLCLEYEGCSSRFLLIVP